jgi:L-lactate dehydrogenase complex protein LldG
MLSAIRSSLGRDRLPETTISALKRRLQHSRQNVVPERGRTTGRARVDTFIAEAERVDATTARLGSLADVPKSIVTYLRAGNLPAAVRVGTDPLLQAIPWPAEPLLQVSTGPAANSDVVSVTSAFAGIAETGTLMLLSDAKSPTTLNFLPTAHVVILPVERVVAAYEDAWQRLRARYGAGKMPRAVNWITGPSRTADIEQTLLLGAHGPKRLHILVVDADVE